jgi:hypothetical protein
MSIADQFCWCCSQPYWASTPVRPACNCGVEECSKCRKCPEHCHCPRQLYDITIEIVRHKDYPVEASSTRMAETLALEAAIKEFPNCDVWVKGTRPKETA